MTIISISLSSKILDDIEFLQKDYGLSGRSEVIRMALRTLIADKLDKEKLLGDLGCVMVVTHSEEHEQSVTSIKHKFDDIIKTHLHSKLKKKKCLETFVIEGDASKIREMEKGFQSNTDMDNVKLMIT